MSGIKHNTPEYEHLHGSAKFSACIKHDGANVAVETRKFLGDPFHYAVPPVMFVDVYSTIPP